MNIKYDELQIEMYLGNNYVLATVDHMNSKSTLIQNYAATLVIS